MLNSYEFNIFLNTVRFTAILSRFSKKEESLYFIKTFSKEDKKINFFSKLFQSVRDEYDRQTIQR